MKELLEKLFDSGQPTTTVATVQRCLSPGLYELVDDAGRTMQAMTDMVVSAQTRVYVQAGRIVAVAGRNQTIRTYEV